MANPTSINASSTRTDIKVEVDGEVDVTGFTQGSEPQIRLRPSQGDRAEEEGGQAPASMPVNNPSIIASPILSPCPSQSFIARQNLSQLRTLLSQSPSSSSRSESLSPVQSPTRSQQEANFDEDGQESEEDSMQRVACGIDYHAAQEVSFVIGACHMGRYIPQGVARKVLPGLKAVGSYHCTLSGSDGFSIPAKLTARLHSRTQKLEFNFTGEVSGF